jgi:regulator of replication initiation timing
MSSSKTRRLLGAISKIERRLYNLIKELDTLKAELSSVCFEDTWLLRELANLEEDEQAQEEQQEYGEGL